MSREQLAFRSERNIALLQQNKNKKPTLCAVPALLVKFVLLSVANKATSNIHTHSSNNNNNAYTYARMLVQFIVFLDENMYQLNCSLVALFQQHACLCVRACANMRS